MVAVIERKCKVDWLQVKLNSKALAATSQKLHREHS